MARAEGSSLEQAFGLRPPRLFRRGNQDCFVRVFCQFWFWWVDALLVVFRRAKKICPLLCPRLSLDLCACLGVSVFGLCVWDKWECSAAGAWFSVWFCLACPPGRLANRRGLFRRGNQDCFVRVFCQFWFWWVDALLVVFRRATKIPAAPSSSAHPD